MPWPSEAPKALLLFWTDSRAPLTPVGFKQERNESSGDFSGGSWGPSLRNTFQMNTLVFT